ncbi:transporter substrate-binding domain-containing protein [Pseudomonas sp. Irchel s3a18]|uniref:transporter substrate-binding domain-containing protein n=1 Tax=Pseudomonas sp. Irchel s3a18 TaxID=2009053 RepID=UPI0021155B1D|nr:transporter substrate-binding domain-containing protein [Pseudomonas sp. Irchel s3a18]
MLCASMFFSFPARALEQMHLEGQVGLPRVAISLGPEERRLLQKHQILRLGVAAASHEPLELVRGQSVRGITADFLKIISSSLGLKTEVRVYPDWTAALAALSAREIDVLGRGSSYEQQLPGMLLSHPYADNQPVLVGRIGDLEDEKLLVGDRRMAVVDGYAPLTELADHFPQAKLDVYETVREALYAVEDKNAGWVVCDAASAAYQLALGEFPSLRMRPLTKWRPVGYSFVFRADDVALSELFNRVLDTIPQLAEADILGHWVVSARFDSERPSVFTQEQLDWLATRPKVKVVVDGGTPPYSFFDDDGRFSGLQADLLAEIALRTGIRFQFVQSNTLGEVLGIMRAGDADIASMLLATPERKAFLDFTEPYLQSSFALVAPRNSSVKKLLDLEGQRVATTKSGAVVQYMQEFYPRTELVLTDSNLENLMKVADGSAEGAVLFLPVARYLINQYFTEDLRVVMPLPQLQAALPFAVAKDNPMLYGVMQASVAQLEPRLIGKLLGRWHTSLPAKSSVWAGYQRKLRWVFLLNGAVLLLLLIWLGYWFINRSRKRAEKARQLFRSTLLDGIPQSVAVLDLHGRFVLCNQTFFTVFRVHPESVIGRTWGEVNGLDPAQEGAQQRALAALLAGQETIDVQQIEVSVQGDTYTFRQWTVLHYGVNGQVVGGLTGWVDITDVQFLLQKLQEARDRAVEASEAKSRFLAVMSHEIRTPLNAIVGLLELTMERVDRGEAWDRESIEIAYSSSGALMLLIGDILDLAKIESGRLTLDPERNNPRKILESVYRVFYGVATQKGLHLELDMQLGSTCDVLVDGGRLKQVLSNLLSNAIKFTDRGSIKLSVRAHEVGSDLSMEFVVQDSGIGICAEDQAILFQPFSQVRGSSGQRGGSGLGLVICYQLLEMMGGRVNLYSELTVGTRVTVELLAPILEDVVSEEVVSLSDPIGGASLNVLVVDDHLPNRLLLRQQLLFLGHHVREAANGQQAIEVLREQAFDVVFTDCNMPIMDGYELARHVRSAEREGLLAPCLIIGFTANAQVEARLRCLEVDMDDCLFKPVGLSMLRSCLGKVVQHVELNKVQGRITQAAAPGKPGTTSFDLALLQSLTAGDQQVMHLLLSEVYSTNEVDVRRLNELLSARRWRDLGQVVHRLKGAAQMVGAQQLIDASRVYEEGLAQALEDDDAHLRAMAVLDAVAQLQSSVKSWMTASG